MVAGVILMKGIKMEDKIIGKPVIVRANIAGVHAGIAESVDFKNQTIVLKTVRRLWRVYTRDKSGSISDVAANGLKPDAEHSIGAVVPTTTIINPAGLEVTEMTPGAWESVLNYKE